MSRRSSGALGQLYVDRGPTVWRAAADGPWSRLAHGVMTMRAFAWPCRTSWMDSLTEPRGLVS